MPLDHLTRRHVLLGSAALALVATFPLMLRAQDGTETDPGAPQAEPGHEVVEMTMGDPDAPVTVIEYASFTCPHCATFHQEVFPRLKEEYIDTGRVHFILREVFFDRPSLWAAMLARCAGEDRYFGMAGLLFEEQETWARPADGPAIVEALYSLGRQAGMTRETMDACLQDSGFARTLVARYQEQATADDIQSTPFFIINGERVGNLAWEDFRATLDAALGG